MKRFVFLIFGICFWLQGSGDTDTFSLLLSYDELLCLNPDSVAAFSKPMPVNFFYWSGEVENFNLQPIRESHGLLWPFWVLMVSVFMVALVRSFFSWEIENNLRSLARGKGIKQTYGGQEMPTTYGSILLLLNATISFSLIGVYWIGHHFTVDLRAEGVYLFFNFFVLAGLFFGGRYLVFKFLGWVAPLEEELMEYNSAFYSGFKIWGLASLPGLFFLFFGSESIASLAGAYILLLFVFWGGVSVLFGLEILRRVRNLSVVRLLLYICALEIAPVALILKFSERFFLISNTTS